MSVRGEADQKSQCGSKSARQTEREGPSEGVGHGGVQTANAGVGQAGRQAQGNWQEENEGEVNRGHLQARGRLLVQVPMEREVCTRVDETDK